MSILISVIVPVYKVEKYLDRCIESIINQTYKNLEIILVDDGSPDRCPKMCDEWAKKDDRIIDIHKKNGGLSDARNAALDVIKGDYITFVDSDDWIESDFIEELIINLEKESADISIVGYTLIWDNGKIKKISNENEYYVYDKDGAIQELLKQNKFQCMVCQKMYKKYIFDSIRFPVGKLYEDVAVALPIFLKANKVVVTGKSKYNYYQRKDGIVNSKFNVNKLFFLECCKEIIDYSNSYNKKYDKEAHVFYLRALLMFILQLYKTGDNISIIKNLENEIIKHKKYIWSNSYMELRKKIVLTLICMHFPGKILAKIWEKYTE